jgi:hypothetical protein
MDKLWKHKADHQSFGYHLDVLAVLPFRLSAFIFSGRFHLLLDLVEIVDLCWNFHRAFFVFWGGAPRKDGKVLEFVCWLKWKVNLVFTMKKAIIPRWMTFLRKWFFRNHNRYHRQWHRSNNIVFFISARARCAFDHIPLVKFTMGFFFQKFHTWNALFTRITFSMENDFFAAFGILHKK